MTNLSKVALNNLSLTDGFDLGWLGIIIALFFAVLMIIGAIAAVMILKFIFYTAKRNYKSNNKPKGSGQNSINNYLAGFFTDTLIVSALAAFFIFISGLIDSWENETWLATVVWVSCLVALSRVLTRLKYHKSLGEMIIKAPPYSGAIKRYAIVGDIILPTLVVLYTLSQLSQGY